jgi:hypothetical protein
MLSRFGMTMRRLLPGGEHGAGLFVRIAARERLEQSLDDGLGVCCCRHDATPAVGRCKSRSAAMTSAGRGDLTSLLRRGAEVCAATR